METIFGGQAKEERRAFAMRDMRMTLADDLREATRALHHRAERTGVIADILRGEVTRSAYATLLRNLLPVYCALERGLEAHRPMPGVRLIVRPELYRAQAIEQDLAALGAGIDRLALLPEGEEYALRIAEITDADPVRLIGHAYTRYLGDLSGGQVLRKLLARSLGLRSAALTLYDFPRIADLEGYKAGYRAALSRAASEADAAAIVDEALAAFRITIALSCAIHDAAVRYDNAEIWASGPVSG